MNECNQQNRDEGREEKRREAILTRISKLMYIFFNFSASEEEDQRNNIPGHKSFTKETTLNLINLLGSKIEGFGSPIVETFEPLSLSNIKNILQYRISCLLNNRYKDQTLKKERKTIQIFDIIENLLNGKRLMFAEKITLIKTLQEFFPKDETLQAIDVNNEASCDEYLNHLKDTRPEVLKNNSKLKILKFLKLLLREKYAYLFKSSHT